MIRSMMLVLAIFTGAGPVCFSQDRANAPVKPDISSPPRWLQSHKFTTKQFVFARARYRAPSWATDYPEADEHFVAKIRSVTSLSAKASLVELKDLNRSKPSMLYICRAGAMELSEGETRSLRSYLQAGGFVMFDDSWGKEDLEKIERLLANVLPGRKCEDLRLSWTAPLLAFEA